MHTKIIVNQLLTTGDHISVEHTYLTVHGVENSIKK